ncbi:hypothetical protein pb186bvf_006589 [Paramecium bursaria]
MQMMSGANGQAQKKQKIIEKQHQQGQKVIENIIKEEDQYHQSTEKNCLNNNQQK